MRCTRCGRNVIGTITVSEERVGPFTAVVLKSSPDRDWLCCDSCAVVLCHGCCRYPESGYCDACIAEYSLYDHLVETGRIKSDRERREHEAP